MTRLAERLVKAHHVDAAEFMHLMTVGGSSARRTAALAGFFDLSHVLDGPLRYGAFVRFDTIPSSPKRRSDRWDKVKNRKHPAFIRVLDQF